VKRDLFELHKHAFNSNGRPFVDMAFATTHVPDILLIGDDLAGARVRPPNLYVDWELGTWPAP
jgi:hypothetical protein